MSKLLVELVTSPEDLESGDVVIYSSLGRFVTAKVEKKPVLDPRYKHGYFKSTRCLVSVKVLEIDTHKWDNKTKTSYKTTVKVNVQKFDTEDFNKVKYIKFGYGEKILRIINQ